LAATAVSGKAVQQGKGAKACCTALAHICLLPLCVSHLPTCVLFICPNNVTSYPQLCTSCQNMPSSTASPTVAHALGLMGCQCCSDIRSEDGAVGKETQQVPTTLDALVDLFQANPRFQHTRARGQARAPPRELERLGHRGAPGLALLFAVTPAHARARRRTVGGGVLRATTGRTAGPRIAAGGGKPASGRRPSSPPNRPSTIRSATTRPAAPSGPGSRPS